MSENVTIVIGSAGSGKTTRISEIIENTDYSLMAIEDIKTNFGMQHISDETDIVVFEPTSIKNLKANFSSLKKLISGEQVLINRKHEKPISVKFPHIIIDLQCSDENELNEIFGRRINQCNVINMDKDK